MMKAGFLLFAIACGPSQDLGPAVTCSDVKLVNSTGSCSLVANSACSDGSLYEIDCQDDSTCTCTMNGSIGKSIIASNSPSGFCANVSASSLHDLGAKCGWNLNP
jgi:hypothetical protein